MSKFKVGDRVACFGFGSAAFRYCGTIDKIRTNSLWVKLDGDTQHTEWHVKQCRRLIKKKREYIWIYNIPPSGSVDNQAVYSYNPGSCNNSMPILFIRAKEKKP